MSRRAQTIRRLKVLYVWQAVGPASWGRFASLFYDAVQLSPSQIGVITGSMPAARAVATPLWGAFADRCSTKKRVALTTQSFGAATLLLLTAPGVANSFEAVWLVSVASACFASGGVLDAYALDVLGPAERGRFGEIRLWSAVSWGALNFGMGYVADLTHSFRYNIFIFFVCTMVSTAILAFLVPDAKTSSAESQQHAGAADDDDDDSAGYFSEDDDDDDGPVVRRDSFEESPEDEPSATNKKRPRPAATVLFGVELLVIGAGMGLVERLLFVYVVEVLGGSYSLCGLTVVATVVFEIPLFAKAKKILAVLGHELCFVLALLCYVPRVLAYTFLTRATKEWIVLIELCHGVTFALMFAAAVDKAAELAPPGREATYQTAQNAVRSCLAAGLGAALGGWYWQRVCANRSKHRDNCRVGAVKLFRCAAAVFALVLGLHLLWLLADRALLSCSSLLQQRKSRVSEDSSSKGRRRRVLSAAARDDGEEQEREEYLRSLHAPLLVNNKRDDESSDADELETICAGSVDETLA